MAISNSGVDPQKQQKVQAVGQNIQGVITKDFKTSTLTIQLTSEDQNGSKMAQKLIDQMGTMVAQQMMFGISGKIREIGRPE